MATASIALTSPDSLDPDQGNLSSLDRLLPHHYTMLSVDSGISDAVIRARGYRSLPLEPGAGYSELKKLGFHKSQIPVDVQGLLLPLYGPLGDRRYTVYRPDRPNLDPKGKALKYQLPKGCPSAVDVPRLCLPAVKDPHTTIWVTEGQRKADALASLGVCAVAILGVWNFRGTDSHGGVRNLPEWREIAWKGRDADEHLSREVVITFDNDWPEKPAIRAAAQQLRAMLTYLGATVRVLCLPASPVHAPKIGVDDYLTQGHTLPDLEALVYPASVLDDKPKRPTDPQNITCDPLLCFKDGTPKSKLKNVVDILCRDPRWQDVLGFDEFSATIVFRQPPPFHPAHEAWKQRPVEEADDIALLYWLEAIYGVSVGAEMARNAILLAAQRHRFHPVKLYLEALRWDETPRLNTLLKTYAGATGDPLYLHAVAPGMCIGAVARIYEPGCKMDTVPIFEGGQGMGKTSFVETLTGSEWFSSDLPDVDTLDAKQSLRGKWIIEMGELSAMARAEVFELKKFVSNRVDRYRPSYGRRSADFPRQTIFIGTTNSDEYLKDDTGGRRWWPIALAGPIDLVALARDRDQLWAEAVTRYKARENWHLSPTLEATAADIQLERREADPWEAPVVAFVYGRTEPFTSATFLEQHLCISKASQTSAHHRRVGAILRPLGWTSKLRTHADWTGRVKAWGTDEPLSSKRTDGTDDLQQSELSDQPGKTPEEPTEPTEPIHCDSKEIKEEERKREEKGAEIPALFSSSPFPFHQSDAQNIGTIGSQGGIGSQAPDAPLPGDTSACPHGGAHTWVPGEICVRQCTRCQREEY